jgi:hypothetical protein
LNDQLQAALAEILKSLHAASQQVGEVAKEQLPLLVQEYLRWGFTSNALVACAFAAATVPMAVIGIRCYRAGFAMVGTKDSHGYANDPFGWFMGASVMGALCAFTLLAGVGGAVYNMVQIAIAPRVYLLERVASLVR